jgi:hypothetical protein
MAYEFSKKAMGYRGMYEIKVDETPKGKGK